MRLWRVPREEAFGRPFVLPGELSYLAFSADAASLLARTRGGSFRRWSLQGDLSSNPPRPNNEVDAARGARAGAEGAVDDAPLGSLTSPDGLFVLAIDADGHARLHDAATGKTIGPPLGASTVCCLAISPDNSHLAAGTHEGKIALWKSWRPMEGPPDVVRSTVELLAGMKLVSHETFKRLSPVEIDQHRRRLAPRTTKPTAGKHGTGK